MGGYLFDAWRPLYRGPATLNALSVDVEDWFHSFHELKENRTRWDSRLASHVDLLLSLLDEHQARATFFVLGEVAAAQPALVRGIDAAGHEVGSHGYHHERAYERTREEFRQDVSRSVRLLEDLLGKPVLGYRAPWFSITSLSLWALQELAEIGIVYDSSIFPGHAPVYGIPDLQSVAYQVTTPSGASLIELPPSTHRFMSVRIGATGGFYLRALPYRLTHWTIVRTNGVGYPAVVYVHPWELDSDQPRVRTGLLERIIHYRALPHTRRKLTRLLRDFRFTSIDALLTQWGSGDRC